MDRVLRPLFATWRLCLTSRTRLEPLSATRAQDRSARLRWPQGAHRDRSGFGDHHGLSARKPRKPRARKKRTAKKLDDASPFLASGEGTLPERGSDSENAARSRPRTSLGDGVVKPGGGRIAWAHLLRRVDWVDVLAAVGVIAERSLAASPSAKWSWPFSRTSGCRRRRRRGRGRGVRRSSRRERPRLVQGRARRRREGGRVPLRTKHATLGGAVR